MSNDTLSCVFVILYITLYCILVSVSQEKIYPRYDLSHIIEKVSRVTSSLLLFNSSFELSPEIITCGWTDLTQQPAL